MANKNKLCDDYAALEQAQQRATLERLADKDNQISDLRREVWLWKIATVAVLAFAIVAVLAIGTVANDTIVNMLLYQ